VTPAGSPPGGSAASDVVDEPSTGADAPDETSLPTDAAGAVELPPVVVTVVAHDPGDWFEAALRSVAAQTYRNLSVLVVDAGSAEPVAPRVAAVVPEARVRRLDSNPGFGPSCNELIGAVSGAAFHLLCHDDVLLAPNAVRVLVEEAYRSNAGIVGPKLVRWDEPDRMLSVGMGADRFGAPVDLVERGELDQAQHDGVRDVFFVPGAATLVRADLFESLGGFDPSIDLLGEDLDLGWRAHVVGARVVVAPSARVAHLEALGLRRSVDDRRRLQLRHRQRAVRVATRTPTRVVTLLGSAVLALAEVVASLVLGRFAQVGDVVGAWTWNLRHRRDLRDRRSALNDLRAASDREVRALQSGGSARLRRFLRGRTAGGDDRLQVVAGSRGRALTESLRSASGRTVVLAWLAVLGLLTVGSRSLLGGDIPAVGELVPFEPIGSMVGSWGSGYRTVGLGASSAAPPALGLFSAASLVTLGAEHIARALLILGALPVGAIGAWRLVRPIGSRRAAVVALLAWVLNPLAYDALSRGRWAALVVVAVTPWMVLQLARASARAPFGPDGEEPLPGAPRRSVVHHALVTGLLVAAAGLWFPAAPLYLLAVLAALCIGGLLAGDPGGLGRMAGAGIGGAVIGFVVLLPWSAGLLGAPFEVVLGPGVGHPALVPAGDALRFQTGPVGASELGWGLALAATLPLLLGRRWRFGWAVRAWVLIAAGWASIVAIRQGWLGHGPFPDPEILLAPGAAGVALAIGFGMAAFEVDLPDYHFGWRQVASLLAGAAFVIGAIPVAGSSFGGRWELPERDHLSKVTFAPREQDTGGFRILWVGSSDDLPGGSWGLGGESEGLSFTVTERGVPVPEQLWIVDQPTGTEQLAGALSGALEGSTSRLGSLVGPMGVRYVAVPEGLAPGSAGGPPATVVDQLDRQLDLGPVAVGSGMTLFENTAWVPLVAEVQSDQAIPGAPDDGAARPAPELDAATAVLDETGRTSWSGDVTAAGSVLAASQLDDAWRIDNQGRAIGPDLVLGWSMAFPGVEAGPTVLDRPSSAADRVAAVVPLALLAAACVAALATRRDRTSIGMDDRRRGRTS
jgi:GT2 family glycosyltransferase